MKLLAPLLLGLFIAALIAFGISVIVGIQLAIRIALT